MLFVSLLWATAAVRGQETGWIEGRVVREGGDPVAGVTVFVEGAESQAPTTGPAGTFQLGPLPAGTRTVVFSLGAASERREVEVEAGRTTDITEVVSWQTSFADSLTVYSASRRQERIVEAPAAVATVSRATMEEIAPTGQIPRIFERAGVELTQSGLYDFKLNVRGLNQSVNRRVAVLVDGRDPSFPLLGAQEWASLAFSADDIESAELVSGPSSALYGANAFNGVINLITKRPRDSQGGLVRLTAGELATAKADFRLAGRISDESWYKVLGGYTKSEDFYRSRNEGVEYSVPCAALQTADCLYLEPRPLPLDEDRIGYLSARYDRDLGTGRSLVVEGGDANVEGYVLTSAGSRFQITDLDRPWARFDLNGPRWNLLASYTGRTAEALILSSGTPSFTDEYRVNAELQGNWTLAGGRGRVVAGASAGQEHIDSADPHGVQTLLPEPAGADLYAVFGQVDWELSPATKLVLAARVDDTTLHDPQISPRVALVHALGPRHTLRFTYGQGFQRPNYPEYFIRVPLAPALDLSPFEAICALGQVSCGFDRPVPILAVGNEDLDVEKIRSAEVGYTGVLADRVLLTVDAYVTDVDDFVLQFVPLVGTELGRANHNFPAYMPPPGLDPALSATLLALLQQGLGPLYPFLSTEDGLPLFAFNTPVNYGEARSFGLDVGVDAELGPGWRGTLHYSYFDFDPRQELAAAPFSANRPDNLVTAGVRWARDRFSASLDWRWVEAFRWVESINVGDVPSYDVVNLAAGWDVTDEWAVGLNVSNLFDDVHYESFSGDLLARRGLAYVTYRW